MSKINRRDFIKTSAAATGTLLLPFNKLTISSINDSKKKPNFLLIICDQMVIDAISKYKNYFNHPAYACHWVETPNIDRLVENGISFLESYSANPICSPARSSFLTGRYSSETGVIHNNIGIDQNVVNIGQWLEEHTTYDRVYCGKWHAGGQWNVPDVDGPRIAPGFETLPNGPGDFGQQMDYGVCGAVEAYIRNYSKPNPFLIVAGFMNPHDIGYWAPPFSGRLRDTDFFNFDNKLPVLPPNQNYSFKEIWDFKKMPQNMFSDLVWRNYIYDYDHLVELLDRSVGRLLDAVKARGDDTIIIFTSDHGEGLGRHRRVGKWHPYQSSVKVPFIVYGPKFGIMSNVVDSEHFICGMDLISTICDYAEIETPPNVRGKSLRPILEGKKMKKWRSNVYIELQETGRIIRTNQYKYIMAYKKSQIQNRKTLESVFLTKKGSASEFIQGEGERFQKEPVKLLFDLENDPWEMNNLTEDKRYTDVIAEHEYILRDKWENKLVPGHHFTRDF